MTGMQGRLGQVKDEEKGELAGHQGKKTRSKGQVHTQVRGLKQNDPATCESLAQ